MVAVTRKEGASSCDRLVKYSWKAGISPVGGALIGFLCCTLALVVWLSRSLVEVGGHFASDSSDIWPEQEFWRLHTQDQIWTGFTHRPLSEVKILLYMTTNMGKNQVRYFPCWERATRRLPLLQQADLLLYTSQPPPDDKVLRQNLKHFRNVRVEYFNDTHVDGTDPRQAGAIRALTDPWKHGWFNGYDWVIRLNPDVLLRDDTWLRHILTTEAKRSDDTQLVRKPGITTPLSSPILAIVHNCHGYMKQEHESGVDNPTTNKNDSMRMKLNSDFHIFRPSALNAEAFLDASLNPQDNAELHFTRGLMHTSSGDTARTPVLLDELQAIKAAETMLHSPSDSPESPWIMLALPQAEQFEDRCRILGHRSFVIHHHKYWKGCPNYFSRTDLEALNPI